MTDSLALKIKWYLYDSTYCYTKTYKQHITYIAAKNSTMCLYLNGCIIIFHKMVFGAGKSIAALQSISCTNNSLSAVIKLMCLYTVHSLAEISIIQNYCNKDQRRYFYSRSSSYIPAPSPQLPLILCTQAGPQSYHNRNTKTGRFSSQR